MTARWRGPVAWAFVLWAMIVGSYLLIGVVHPELAHGLTYTQARHMSAAKVRAVIRHEAKRAHLGKADTAALVELARLESRFHATSKSRGGRCLGVMQLSRSMCRGHRWWEPAWNVRRAIRYVRYSSHHYRTPRRALAFHRKRGWY